MQYISSSGSQSVKFCPSRDSVHFTIRLSLDLHHYDPCRTLGWVNYRQRPTNDLTLNADFLIWIAPGT